MDHQRPEPAWSQLDDAALLEYLAEALRRHEGPPPSVTDLAKASFGLRQLDAELAALVADSLTDATGPRVRSVRAPRMVSFESADLAVELEAAPAGSGWRIVGQLEPPAAARIELLRPNGSTPARAQADALGRFALDVPEPGPLSLLCRRDGRPAVATAWILLR